MKARSVSVVLVLFSGLTLALPRLRAQDGVAGALLRTRYESPLSFSAALGDGFAVADFDNDSKLDGAVLLSSIRDENRFRIELHLTGSPDTVLWFESRETELQISAQDINHDGATDVIVEQPLTHKRVLVWLNDGHGRFRRGRVQDFGSAEVPNGGRLQTPAQARYPGVSIAQQRPQTMMLAASFVRGRPPSTRASAPVTGASGARASLFCRVSSRAPPGNLSS